MHGFNKQIRVIFNGAWTMDQIKKLGEIREMNGQEILLEVEHDKERVRGLPLTLDKNTRISHTALSRHQRG